MYSQERGGRKPPVVCAAAIATTFASPRAVVSCILAVSPLQRRFRAEIFALQFVRLSRVSPLRRRFRDHGGLTFAALA